MAKIDEIDYLKNIGDLGRAHAMDKPFRDPSVGKYLVSIGVVFTLLPKPPARLLDLGCGTGWTSRFFARAGYDVVGQDISPAMLEAAEELRQAEGLTGLRYMVSDFENMGFESEFDCAVFFDALHHCEDESAALRSVFRALRPGGCLITHEPGAGHAQHPDSVHAKAAYGVTERDMPPATIWKAAKATGFSEMEIYPMPSSVLKASYTRQRRVNAPRALALLSLLHMLGDALRWRVQRRTRAAVVVLRKTA